MQPLIELRSVSKHFGPTTALERFYLELQPGEVHALVGENGAGKSTALAIMSGVFPPDQDLGEVIVSGAPVTIASPAQAKALGIACVFQELSLAGGLSVAENIFAGRPPKRFGRIDWRSLRIEARRLLAAFDFDFDVRDLVDHLPAGARQLVEIAKALSLGSRILLLDEPTSALSANEIQAMLATIRKLKSRGIGIIYVSHHLSEIFEIADRITVMRDGRAVTTLPVGQTSESRVVFEMLGASVTMGSGRRGPRRPGAAILRARALTSTGRFDAVDVTLHGGEIVAFAGIVGSHAVNIARSLCGLETPDSGSIEVDGKQTNFRSLRAAMRLGIAYVPEDRKTEGLFLERTISDNVASATLARHSSLGMMRKHSMRRTGECAIARFAIRASGPEMPASALSGGNQQKVMLAKWLETEPRVLIVNEPSKGVDVGARRQIHEALSHCAERGVAVAIVSSDFGEIVALADRILVVRHGRISEEVGGDQATEDLLISLATGVGSRRSQVSPSVTA